MRMPETRWEAEEKLRLLYNDCDRALKGFGKIGWWKRSQVRGALYHAAAIVHHMVESGWLDEDQVAGRIEIMKLYEKQYKTRTGREVREHPVLGR